MMHLLLAGIAMVAVETSLKKSMLTPAELNKKRMALLTTKIRTAPPATVVRRHGVLHPKAFMAAVSPVDVSAAAVHAAAGAPPPLSHVMARPATSSAPAGHSSRSTGISQIAEANLPPCPQRAPGDRHPIIARVRGTIASGGNVTIKGECLGTSPSPLKLAGQFAGGGLALNVLSWHDDEIVALIPHVKGVQDQPVTLSIQPAGTTGLISNTVNLQFTAERERVMLSSQFITNVACPFDPGGCSTTHSSDLVCQGSADCFNAFGTHSATNTVKGSDSWQAKAPPGWVLDNLSFVTTVSSASYGGGFDQGPPDQAVFTVDWSSTNQHNGDAMLLEDDKYVSQYAFAIYAIGPVGTMPQ